MTPEDLAARVKARVAATQASLAAAAAIAAGEMSAAGAYVRGTGPRPLFPGEPSDGPGPDRGDQSTDATRA